VYIPYDSLLPKPAPINREYLVEWQVTLNTESLRLDWRELTDRIETQLARFLEESGCEKFVIGLSGGLDSSTAVTLAVKAVGKSRVIGLFLPDSKVTPPEDIHDAEKLAKKIGIRTYTVDLTAILSCFSAATPFFQGESKVANGNLRARIRMSLLYYYANLENALVLGTGDRSEILIGYFTKYGDGATDILPLGDLYKTQVRELARFLKISRSIVEKPSSPRLWIGHTAKDELGLDYDVIDMILHGYFDLKLSKEKIAQELDVQPSKVKLLLERSKLSEHKRKLPPLIIARG
jgi:NAD+ synthase